MQGVRPGFDTDCKPIKYLCWYTLGGWTAQVLYLKELRAMDCNANWPLHLVVNKVWKLNDSVCDDKKIGSTSRQFQRLLRVNFQDLPESFEMLQAG